MSVRLADVIDVLDDAYPPGLAQSWDSVGLVCGDPDEAVESVTVAVDATAAVVASVPERGLLLAHHPLLLRGVDTVAADTAKGALIHRLIRTGAALFTAHTNADAANPGVSDALAEALGLTVEAVLDPAAGDPDTDKWVIFVPAGARRGGARGAVRRRARAHRRLLALLLERHRHADSSCRTTARRRRSARRLGGARGRGPRRGGRAVAVARAGAGGAAGRPPLRGALVRRARPGGVARGRRHRPHREPARADTARATSSPA